MARRYEFYVLVARTISHSFASLTCEILFLPPNIKFISSCHRVISSIYYFFSSAFPLHFKSGENPSHGIMEIYKNSSWQKLCTRRWDADEENLTCKAMGYSNDVGYANAMGHKNSTNTSNTLMHFNCTSLTECGINIVNKTQLCKGT